ncbi:MAG: GNAT family N-acetyltransferase [Candidatus Altiarchaeota archaeon]
MTLKKKEQGEIAFGFGGPPPKEIDELHVTSLGNVILTLRPIRKGDERMLREFLLAQPKDALEFRFNHEMSDEDIKKYAKNAVETSLESQILLAMTREGKLAGFCQYSTPPLEEPHLSILVGKDHEGAGAGRELLLRTIQMAKSDGITQLEVDINPDNKKAISFFSRYQDDPALNYALEEVGSSKDIKAYLMRFK